MSKNLTRKGLALGAVAALGSTLFAGAPAFAVPAITIAPASGSTYNVLVGDDFELKVFGNTDYTWTTTSDVQWEVKKAADQTIAVATAPDSGSTYTTETALTAGTSTTAWYAQTAAAGTSAGANWMKIDPAANSTSKTVSVDVRAYIELDGTAGLSGGDLASNSVTVKFLGSADVAATAVVSDFIVGAASQEVKATIPNLNYNQTSAGSAKVVWIDNGTAQTAANLSANADKDALTASYTNTAVAGDIIGAKVQALDYEGGSLKDVSAAVYKTAIASEANTIADFGSTKGATVRSNASDYTAVVTATSGKEYVVKAETKTFNVSAVLKKDSTVLGAGVPVTVTVAEDFNTTGSVNSVATGTKISAGGKSFTAAAGADSLTFTAFTDAAGKVSVDVTSTTGATTDRVYVSFASGTATTATAVYGWVTNAVAKIAEVGVTAGVRTVVKGSAVSVTYNVLDAFGQPFVDSTKTYRVAVTASGTSGATTAGSSPYSGSAVTVNLTDNSTSTGGLTLTAQLEYLNTATPPAYVSTLVSSINTTSSFSVVSTVAAPASATLVTRNGADNADYVYGTNADAALTLVDYKNVDLRLDANSVAAPTTSETNVIKGVITDNVGAGVAGAAVTISGPGAAFSAASGNVHSAGSITVNTDASGNYSVKVYSHTTGVITFTVTAGAVVKTAKIKFAAAAANSATKVEIVSAANVVSGQFVAVKLKATDKYGNPVNTTTASDTTTSVKLTVAGGNGYWATTPGTETDADGLVSGVWMTSVADTGSLAVTAEYDHATAANDLKVTGTITLGAAPVVAPAVTAAASGSTAKIYASVANAAGKWVVVKVNGKFAKSFAGTSAKKVVAVAATAGAKNVSIFVGGVKVLGKVVTVK